MAEAKPVGENISIKLVGLRGEIESVVERYESCLRYPDVHDRVVRAALEAATKAAMETLEGIEAKAAAFKPFEL